MTPIFDRLWLIVSFATPDILTPKRLRQALVGEGMSK